MNIRYTLQSMRNSKYISSLFSDGHNETFQANDVLDAYTWADEEQAKKIKFDIGLCELIIITY